MGNTVTIEIDANDMSQLEELLDSCIAEMRRANEAMERDQRKIDVLLAESRALAAGRQAVAAETRAIAARTREIIAQLHTGGINAYPSV